jgi:hypothetical protein
MNVIRAAVLWTSSLCLLPSAALAADPFDALGSAGDYTLLGMAEQNTGTASGFVQLGSAAHVYGDVGARYRIETASGVVIEGDSHYGSGGSLHGGSVRGSDTRLSASDWAAIEADAWGAVDAAFDLDATPLTGAPASACTGSPTSSGSVGSQTLVADRDEEGLSVYEFDGCLFLADGETLTIEGTEDDRFVIRVTGGFRMDGGSAIELEGLPGSAVMFVFDRGGWSDEPWAEVTVWNGSVDGGADLSGVFVAPAMYWQLGDGTLLSDTRLLVGGSQANIQDMHSTGPITGSPIEPEEEEDEEDSDHPDDDDDRPIWGSDTLCPPGGWTTIIEDDPVGGHDDASEDTTGSATDDGDEGEDDDDYVGTFPGDHEGGKASGGCAVAGLQTGGLIAWLGVLAVGTRRRRTD